jgi:magnesium-dependent phosphatase 1
VVVVRAGRGKREQWQEASRQRHWQGLHARSSMSVESIVQFAHCLPMLCVLDLDKTLWDCFDAASTQPPFRRVGECEVQDQSGRTIRMHADTPRVLGALRTHGCRFAVASLNPNHDRCMQLLAALGILQFIDSSLIRIRSGQGKRGHLSEIQAACKIPFREMIFFDDLRANVEVGKKLGCTAVLVSSSLLCANTLSRALREHAAHARSRKFFGSWLVKDDAKAQRPGTQRAFRSQGEDIRAPAVADRQEAAPKGVADGSSTGACREQGRRCGEERKRCRSSLEEQPPCSEQTALTVVGREAPVGGRDDDSESEMQVYCAGKRRGTL